ncbi:MAG: WbqC family protein [Myxococcales bacterium]|nr:WbqC family protein [Myxococcales bacterium]
MSDDEPVVGIHQPNFLPWLGYFAKIAASDLFVWLDDVQLPRGRSYVSRVRARVGGASRWLTLPVRRGDGGQRIADARVVDLPRARQKLLQTLRLHYGRAPHFESTMELLSPLSGSEDDRLCELNIRCNEAIAGALGLSPRFVRASELAVGSASTQRLVELTSEAGGARYLSGAGGVGYQDESAFHRQGLRLSYLSYQEAQRGVPTGLSVVDSLMHLGAEETARRLEPGGGESLRIDLLDRPTLRRHIDAMLAITDGAFAQSWQRENFLREAPGKHAHSWLIVESAAVRGFLVATTLHGDPHLHLLIVRAEERGRGLGGRLLQRFVQSAAMAGFGRVTLKVALDAEDALRFYARHGFVRIGSEAGYVRLACQLGST